MGRYRYRYDDWRVVMRLLAQGLPVRAVAERTGVGKTAVHEWGRRDGPPERVWLAMEAGATGTAGRRERSPRQRLDFEDRCVILSMVEAGATHGEIALGVGCSRTTVGRGLRRCGGGAYDPRLAQRDADARAARPKARKLDADGPLRDYVLGKLVLRWSPEEISRRIREDFPADEGMRVSHETIYQALYVQGRGALRHGLGVVEALRSGRRGRRPRSRPRPAAGPGSRAGTSPRGRRRPRTAPSPATGRATSSSAGTWAAA